MNFETSVCRLPYPGRWYYDILRALDYFRYADFHYDSRMQPAVELLLQKRTKEGLWKQAAKHPGAVYFEYEKAGRPGRWNTLRALRVFKYFNIS